MEEVAEDEQREEDTVELIDVDLGGGKENKDGDDGGAKKDRPTYTMTLNWV